jgi:hypothetical protein
VLLERCGIRLIESWYFYRKRKYMHERYAVLVSGPEYQRDMMEVKVTLYLIGAFDLTEYRTLYSV